MAYIRKVKTASGATAVQIVEKRHGVRRIVAHVGSAHDDPELAVLMQSARDRIHAGQQALDLPCEAEAAAGGAVVTGSASEVLWDVLSDAYRRLGFDAVDDEAFRVLVLARIVEPTSKLAAVGVLEEIGVPPPHRNTFTAALRRCVAKDYRAALAGACAQHSARSGAASLVLYDVTTLHFEVENEDQLRRVGMSKERRVDPADPGRAAGRSVRVPARGVLLRGQQGRDHHFAAHAARLR